MLIIFCHENDIFHMPIKDITNDYHYFKSKGRDGGSNNIVLLLLLIINISSFYLAFLGT